MFPLFVWQTITPVIAAPKPICRNVSVGAIGWRGPTVSIFAGLSLHQVWSRLLVPAVCSCYSHQYLKLVRNP